MLNDIFFNFVLELRNKLISSRIFVLSLFYLFLVAILVSRLFKLQLVDGEYYQNNYMQMSEKTIKLNGTRGNIYDTNGELLAYNKLSYSVNISDDGTYKNYKDKNLMIYNLVKILHSYREDIIGELEIGLNDAGEFIFTSESENARLRFLRDFYGLKSINDLDKNNKYKSDVSAKELIDRKFNSYKLDEIYDENGNNIVLSDEEKLDIINIKYSMGFNAFHKYDSTKVSMNIKENTKAAILENIDKLHGVSVDTEALRVYNDSIYFSSIIGYTGKVTENKLEELQKINPDYTLNDIVGRTGIEEYAEQYLQGEKGYKIIHVDNVGHILLEKESKEAKAGSNIYLTIDKNLQIGIYHLLEQQLAGILAGKIVNNDEPNDRSADSTDRKISVKDAYFQLINNNVLDTNHFSKDEAGINEKAIYNSFNSYKNSSISKLSNDILNNDNALISSLEDDMKTFVFYLNDKLFKNQIIIQNASDNKNFIEYYNKFKNGELSIKNFIYNCIGDDLINGELIKTDKKYMVADEIYDYIKEYLINSLNGDNEFDKLLYKNLIKNNVVTGKQLMLCLYEQNVLAHDDNAINLLNQNGENYAYSLLINKISLIEITPAQLALDPCTAGAVVTDVNTGAVKALVSYPGYDNNRLSNRMDVEYFNSLLNDQSLPLYNNATQARKAPGSTFKPLSAIAAVEEKVVGIDELIDCTGRYETIEPFIKCWIYPGKHGPLDVSGAIENSCNFYFAELGHRLSLDENGNYNANLGIERLTKYAKLFGFGEKSGVEIAEIDPIISNERPEQSTFGQGMNAYSNVQLCRYTLALANKGNVYKLSLIGAIQDQYGKMNKKEPVLTNHIDISDRTWEAVRSGMRRVIQNGSASKIFKDLDIEVGGKTGTAQESKVRANHAWFTSFAPYQNPEIALTVNIPYGYSSANAAAAAKEIYKLYFGYNSDLNKIINGGAYNMSNVHIGD